MISQGSPLSTLSHQLVRVKNNKKNNPQNPKWQLMAAASFQVRPLFLQMKKYIFMYNKITFFFIQTSHAQQAPLNRAGLGL